MGERQDSGSSFHKFDDKPHSRDPSGVRRDPGGNEMQAAR